MDKLLIGLCGYAKVGKTTTCSELLSLIPNGKILSFAEPVKQIATDSFGWDGLKDEKGRRLLQLIGTDVGRSYNPNIWVDMWKSKVRILLSTETSILVDDVRFQNEVDAIRELGGVVFRFRCIEREAKYDHISETPESLSVDLNFVFSGYDTPEYVARRMLYAWNELKNRAGEKA